MSTFSHRSFAGGEIAPSLQARVDTDKYQTGAKQIENFIVSKHGGLVRRAGTEWVGELPLSNFDLAEDYNVRYVPYVVNENESYLLEFSHGRLRAIKDGSYIINAFWPITGIAQHTSISGDVVRVTSSSPMSIKSRQPLYIRQAGGVTNINYVDFNAQSTVSRSSTVDLLRRGDFNEGLYDIEGTYTSGGTLFRISETFTKWFSADIPKMRFSQSGRELIVTCPQKYTIAISTAENSQGKAWNLRHVTKGDVWGDLTSTGEIVQPPPVSAPGQFIEVQGTKTGNGWPESSRFHEPGDTEDDDAREFIRYAVTTVTKDGLESCPSYSAFVIQKGTDQETIGVLKTAGGGAALRVIATNAVFSWDSTQTSTGAAYKIALENTYNGLGTAIWGSEAAFTIIGEDWSGESIEETVSMAAKLNVAAQTILSTENYFRKIDKIINKNSSLTLGEDIRCKLGSMDLTHLRVSWLRSKLALEGPVGQRRNSVSDATYRVYRSRGGAYGYLGETKELYFQDVGIAPDYGTTPPIPFNPFPASRPGIRADLRYAPFACCHYQQRRVFGGSQYFPERVWVSAVGEPKRFDSRANLLDSDSFYWDVAGTKINEILHLVSLDKIVVFTRTGEWVASGSDAGTVTPSNINMIQRSQYGSGDLAPLVVGPVAIFYQPRGSVVRDLANMLSTSGYTGDDLTVFAGHLFKNKQITSWDYQQDPDSVVWCTQNGTTLLGMTYLREHKIQAWHRHTFQGDTIVAAAVLPEGTGADRREYLYLCIKRTIDGDVRTYLERMAINSETNWRNWNWVDCGRTVNGWEDNSGTMTITQYVGGGYDEGATVTVTASASGKFTSDSVGERIYFGSEGDVDFYVDIDTYSSGTVVLGTVSADVPAAYQATATSSYGRGYKEVTDLHHLEGRDVSIMGDGNVIASPDNSDFDDVTVTSGVAAVSPPSVRIKVGLPYQSNLETLNIDTVGSQTLADKQKLTGRCVLHLEDSRGGFVGPEEPSGADATENLRALNYVPVQSYVDTNEPYTGYIRVIINPDWNDNGRLFIRQIDPLPLNILAVHPHLEVTKRSAR